MGGQFRLPRHGRLRDWIGHLWRWTGKLFDKFFKFNISFPRAPSDVILDSPVVKTCVSTSSRQCTILDSGHSRFVFTLSFLIKIYFPFSFCLSVSQHSSLDLSRRTKKPKSKKLTCKFFCRLFWAVACAWGNICTIILTTNNPAEQRAKQLLLS